MNFFKILSCIFLFNYKTLSCINQDEFSNEEIEYFKRVYMNEKSKLHKFDFKTCDSNLFLNNSKNFLLDSCIIPWKKSKALF